MRRNGNRKVAVLLTFYFFEPITTGWPTLKNNVEVSLTVPYRAIR